jgi:hypothetical protein
MCVQYGFLYLILPRPKLAVWANIGITRVEILPASYARQLCNKLPTAADKMAYKNTQIEKEISLCMFFLCGLDHRYTHRVATAAFLRTFHHDRKISPGWWLYLPSRTKLHCTLQLRGQIHSHYFICTHMYILCGLQSRSNIYSPTPITAISEDEWKIIVFQI